MEQNNNQIDNQQPCFRKVIGNTTYVVRVRFSESAKETLGEKIKRLIRVEVTQSKTTSSKRKLRPINDILLQIL